MKLGIIAPAPVPHVVGGAERLWSGLLKGLTKRGHDAELVTQDFPENNLAEVLNGYRTFSALDVSHFDAVITGKYPAWMIEHPRHLVYMLHPLRGLYDTYPAQLGDLMQTPRGRALASELERCAESASVLDLGFKVLDDLDPQDPLCAYPGPLAQALVHKLDGLAFAPDRVKAFAAISEEVAARPNYLPSSRPVLVSHPESELPEYKDLTSDEESDTNKDPGSAGVKEAEGPVFFTVSRLDKPKRIDLIIEAFRLLEDQPASLVIAGDGPEREYLKRCAGTDHRIQFLGRVDDIDLAQHYATATAVVFVPDHEDFGYITLEAIRSGTPVITTADSGGAKELLDEGVGGLIVEPSPEALAEAMQNLADKPQLRWFLGMNGKRRARTVSWSELFRLIEDLEPEAAQAEAAQAGAAQAEPCRRKVLVLSTFVISPTIGGGQRRVRNLVRRLALDADVTVLCLAGSGRQIQRRTIELGITQVIVPRSVHHLAAEAEITRVAGLPVDDITCGELWAASPEFGFELDTQLDQLGSSGIVVVSHPFLAPALVDRLGNTPLVYDCHNAEADFKSTMLADADVELSTATWLNTAVSKAESFATSAASAVTACTFDDVEILKKLAPASNATFSVVPNGVDTGVMPLREGSDASKFRAELLALVGADSTSDTELLGRPIAVFIGSWHPPNLDAARLIVEAAAREDRWIFVLAGSHTVSIDSQGLSNVYMIPTFPEESLYPILAGANVALNPMLSGGGSNLKLHDYLAVGVPVLTSSIGARGLSDPAEVAWVCDATADGLVAGLEEIANSQEEREQRSIVGRSRVEQNVDWADLGDRWAQAVLRTNRTSVNHQQRKPRPTPLPPLVPRSSPPDRDPTIDLMNRVGAMALKSSRPKETNEMDPSLRENLRKMAANRMAGQEIPASARLRSLKKLVARAGKIVTNEQVVFNQATTDAMSTLTEQVRELQAQVNSQSHVQSPEAQATTSQATTSQTRVGQTSADQPPTA